MHPNHSLPLFFLVLFLNLSPSLSTSLYTPPHRPGIYRNVKIPNPEAQQAEQQRIQDAIANGSPLRPSGPLNRFRPTLCPQTIQFALHARQIPNYAPSVRAFRSEDLIFDGVQCDAGETYILKSDPFNPQVLSGRYTDSYFFSAASNFDGNLLPITCGTTEYVLYGATIATPSVDIASLKAGVTYIHPNFRLPSGASGYCTMEFTAEGTDTNRLDLTPFPENSTSTLPRTASVYRSTMLRNPEAERREDMNREEAIENGQMEPIPRLNTFRPRLCPGSLQFSLPGRAMAQFAPSVHAFTSRDFVFDSVRCEMNETYVLREDLANPLRLSGRYSSTWFFFATSNLDGMPNTFKCGSVEYSFFGGLISIPAMDFMGLKAGVPYLTLNLALQNDRSSYCTMEFTGLGQVSAMELAPFPVSGEVEQMKPIEPVETSLPDSEREDDMDESDGPGPVLQSIGEALGELIDSLRPPSPERQGGLYE